MKLAPSGFTKFQCGWCDQARGGLWNAAIGYHCTNNACGFLFCDGCARSVGFFGRLIGNCACPRCGNPAEPTVNSPLTGAREDDDEQESPDGAILPNGWKTDDTAYQIVQAIHAGQTGQAGNMLRMILSAISPAQYRLMWSMMPSMGSPQALWGTAMSLFAEIERNDYKAEAAFLEMLRAVARCK